MDGLQIYLAEDIESCSNLERKALTSLGHEVETFPNASTSIKHIRGEGPPQLFISDLHMNGDNGDKVLEYLIAHHPDVPFVISSGTLSDRAKKILTSGIPGLFFIEKREYLDPEKLQLKLEDIMERSSPFLPKEVYMEKLREAKEEMKNIPDVSIEADRIQARVMELIDHYRTLLGSDFDMLKDFSYHGDSSDDTPQQIHKLKNVLDVFAKEKYRENEILRFELTRITDHITRIINTPKVETMPVWELVSRETSPFTELYNDLTFSKDVPDDIEMYLPKVYSKVVYTLLENAIQAGIKNGSPTVNISYDQNQNALVISNKGTLPEGMVNERGEVNLDAIPKGNGFSTGFGVRYAVESLTNINQTVTYTEEGGHVNTIIGLQTTEDKKEPSESIESKPTVLFMDYKDGGRFVGIEDAIPRLNPDFNYVWDHKINRNVDFLAEYDFSNTFLIIMHHGYDMKMRDNFLALIGHPNEEVLQNSLHIRYGFVSGEGSAMDLIIGSAQGIVTGRGIGKDLNASTDFIIEEFPTVKELDKLILDSYEKFQLQSE